MNTLNENLKTALEKKKFESLTTVQEQTIPLFLEAKDIIVEAKTGSGKTLAFLLPLFNKIEENSSAIKALVLAPTQELASQIYKEALLLQEESNLNITSALVIGGANINNQIKKLKEKPNVIIGTPKRVLELIKLKKLSLHTIDTLVLDEADHLLDKSNSKTTNLIRKSTLKNTQVVAFSATIDESTTSRALALMNKGELVKVNEEKLGSNLSHLIVECDRRDKYEVTNKILNTISDGKCIIFTNSKNDLNLLKETLDFHKKNSVVLSGDKNKVDRKNSLAQFKEGNIDILVCSDIAARGLHIPNIDYVINLDYPLMSNEYVHRAGRAGRNNTSGTSICVATKRDLSFINKYSTDLNISFEKKEIWHGQLI
ncbi:MAG: DEAD/DEAH box helicase [Clostridium sp.]|uniref:DEAD/DEAH box helicase n=1 Tax=Clostridium sp. TaxID=1506 RepID=UPI003F3F7536